MLLVPSKQIIFAQRLNELKRTMLQQALLQAVASLDLKQIDDELHRLVQPEYLNRLARYSLRGEIIFAVPCVIAKNPQLLGYYRLLLGFSQKDFSKYGLGRWLKYETTGKRKPARIDSQALEDLCSLLNEAAYQLLDTLEGISGTFFHELSLLTLGSQFQGSYNNLIGNKAAKKLFEILKQVIKVRTEVESFDDHVIQFTNTSGRRVIIRLAADPDVLVTEQLKTRIRHILAIEIKGGSDVSNIHNRLGEAEKTHIKYKQLYPEVQCWTMVGVKELSIQSAKKDSPSTDRFFLLEEIFSGGPVLEEFVQELVALLGLRENE
ncbi:XcyI restriction endonuclease [Moorella thermoacetica]|nr:XcyI restriction endonuclease [Moorella thermoacetica]